MVKHEVVISGIGGSFPKCSSVAELESKIYDNGSFFETGDNSKLGPVDLPTIFGKIKNRGAFDFNFFRIHRKLCNVMDVQTKYCLEKSFEALCDAGINASEIYGSSAAVIMSSILSEHEVFNMTMANPNLYCMVGNAKCMQANRISNYFNFNGPSFFVCSTWDSGMTAINIGASLVANGHVKVALVGGTNIINLPQITAQYEVIRKLNDDGKTKCFSADADGFTRSEGAVVFVLQRAEDARRSYGSIVRVRNEVTMNNSSVYCDQTGFENFIDNFYADLNIKESDLGYIEADGSASLKVDAMELNGLANVFCKRKRNKPLLVGSNKSVIGHAEGASAFMSIVSAAIAFKTGYIPPSLNYSSPNPLIPALLDGRIKVVTEKTPLEGDLIGATCLGIGSAFGHILLKRNPKTRPAIKEFSFPADGIPRIFLLSGRNEEAMKKVLAQVFNKPVDDNFLALNHELFKTHIPSHFLRGYAVVSDITRSSGIENYDFVKRPVWFIFSGMGSHWLKMGVSIMKIPIIRRSIEKSHRILKPKGLNLKAIITSDDETVFENILHAFVGIAAIQIALVDLLDELGIEADGMIGHSVGELGCSYADRCMTAEQVILAAYARGKASNEATLIKGMMAAVGLGYNDIKNSLPEGIEVACHNSSTSCTLSGPTEIMEKFIGELKSKGIFAKLVNVANIAYHSKNIRPAAPALLQYLKEVIKEPKLRSDKWKSTSVPENKWNTQEAKYCSAEYHVNNLLSYVLFEETSAHIPKNAICVEIAPHGLLQAIVKRSHPDCCHIPLTNRAKDVASFLIEAIGKLYVAGIEMDVAKLYPPVEYPVPRETEYMNVVTWDYEEVLDSLSYRIRRYFTYSHEFWSEEVINKKKGNILDVAENYQILGKSTYPKTKTLSCLINNLKQYNLENSVSYKTFELQDIQFHRDLPLGINEELLGMLYQKGKGGFEVVYNDEVLATGQLNHSISPLPVPCIKADFAQRQQNQIYISQDQIYDYFEANDCIFSGPYRNINSITIFERGFAAKIKWRGSIELFLDSVLKVINFYSSVQQDTLMDVESILQLLLDPEVLRNSVKDINIYYDETLGYMCGDGIRLQLFKTKPLAPRVNGNVDLKIHQFVPYSKVSPKVDFIDMCLQIFKENGVQKMHVSFEESSIPCNAVIRWMNDKQIIKNNELQLLSSNRFSESKENTLWNSNKGYLVVAQSGLQDDIIKFLKADGKFYFIHIGNPAELQKNGLLNHLTPIIEQKINDHFVILYKQKKVDFTDTVFKQTTLDNFSKDVAVSQGDKTQFYVMKYQMLSDIISIMQSLNISALNNKRFIFLDESSPQFDPNSSFYMEQLVKNLKVNIALNKSWGSLRKHVVPSLSQFAKDNVTNNELISNVRCKTADLNFIGINLKSMVFPKRYKNFGVIEFSGTMGNEKVFGMGRLTEDNYLEIDPHLCWKKPSHWTMEDAATVPLSYCMAYDLLCIKCNAVTCPQESLLIHGGHTPFAQAVITLAVQMNLTIYTTCFTQLQKENILKTFPQINERNVYIISGSQCKSFNTGIMSSTNGNGVNIIIDLLEDSDLRYYTRNCAAHYGSYFLITNNDMTDDHTIGMSIFFEEVAIRGYNPELIFDLKEQEKLRLCDFILNGIKSNVVKPLDRYSLPETVTKNEATNIVVSLSQDDCPKKAVVPLKKIEKQEPINESSKKNHYMIVGSYNNLWFDLVKWLVSNGAKSVHVVVNYDEIPQYVLLGRFSNFLSKNKYARVVFSGMESMNSLQSCSQFIEKLKNNTSLDTVFYIKPGIENQLTNLDKALRTHWNNSHLVTVGFQACPTTEKRRNDGFKAVSLVMENTMTNSVVLNAIHRWYKKCNENDDVIFLENPILTTSAQDYVDILPETVFDLFNVTSNISNRPRFIEMGTKTPGIAHAPDLNSMFIFPGLKFAQLDQFVSQLMVPTYYAKYPKNIESINGLASAFSEELMKLFDYKLFNLIAEGWSGPLVLTIAKMLESRGKMVQVILLDGAPHNVQKICKQINVSKSIVRSYLPCREAEVSINDLKRWSTNMSQIISREEDGKFTPTEILSSLEILINRYEVVQQFSCKQFSLDSTSVHLFTSYPAFDADLIDLKEMCTIFNNRYIESTSIPFLENPTLAKEISILPMVEIKMGCKTQDLKCMSSRDFIFDRPIQCYI